MRVGCAGSPVSGTSVIRYATVSWLQFRAETISVSSPAARAPFIVPLTRTLPLVTTGPTHGFEEVGSTIGAAISDPSKRHSLTVTWAAGSAAEAVQLAVP